MTRTPRSTLLTVVLTAFMAGFGVSLTAQSKPAVAPAAAVPKKRAEPMKGTATIQMLKPVVKVVGKEVVTTLKIKNASFGPIAGLRVDEYWYDASGNFLPGDFKRFPRVEPGEVLTVELRTPRDARMKSNSYQFSHANGKCKAEVVPKL